MMARQPWWRRLLSGKSPASQAEQAAGGWSVIYGSDLTARTARSDLWKQYDHKDLANAYKLNSMVYGCVSTIATSAMDAPLEIGYEEDGNWNSIGKHPMLDLVYRPNEWYTYELFIQLLITRLLLTGEYYVWKWRNASASRIVELWPVPSHWIEINKGTGNELIASYEVTNQDPRLTVPVVDMARGYYPDPASTIDALAPLAAASEEYQLDQDRKTLFAAMLTNLDVPGLVVKVGDMMSPEDQARMRARLRDRIGDDKRGNTLVLSGEGADVSVINPWKDLDWPGMTGLVETRIAMAFNISTLVVGARVGLDESPYANYREARRAFYNDTMRPLWRGLAGTLTKGLLESEGEDKLEFRFDLTNVPELQEDQDSRATRAVDLFQGGLITRNEARTLSGYPLLNPARGDVYLTPINKLETPSADATT